MLTELDASMLAEAFPREHLSVATSGAQSVARALAPAQWTERFTVRSEQQCVRSRRDCASLLKNCH